MTRFTDAQNYALRAAGALLVLLLGTTTMAKEVSLPSTDVHFLSAKSNGIPYKLYISVPRDYGTSTQRYPVLYLLDADYSFPVVRGIVQHLSERNRLKPMIVVGIAYDGPEQYRRNRTRDYTPHFAPDGGYGPEYQKVSGGAPKFLRFLAEELIPWVDARYRSVPGDRGLAGHSYGGLFTTWVLLTAPETFNHYIIVSPSLWYDGRFLFALEKQLRKNGAKRPRARVYLSVGAREGNAERDMVVDLQQMAAALRQRPNLVVKHEVPDDETHDSVYPAAVSRGIRFTFEGD